MAANKPEPQAKAKRQKKSPAKPMSVVTQLHPEHAEHPRDQYFTLYQGFVWYRPPPKITKGEEQEQSPVKICSELKISARTRDDKGRNHGRLLEFQDADGQQKVLPIPCSELQGEGLEVRRRLADEGLYINPYKVARIMLTDYILNSKPQRTVLCVDRTGWHDHLFIMPEQTIGQSASVRCIFQPKGLNRETGVAQKSSLADWQSLAAMCTGNSRLIFAVSSAFAAPLLSLTDTENGGFNFFGKSSIGKSTALFVACSVYGGPDYRQQWRATVNGLESVCTAHNDCLLVLDEMGEMEPRDLGKSCYMVANGQGKARANEPDRSQWKILMLSSAENTLGQYMNETGKPVKAGQCVRLIDIPADAGAGHGLFEDLKNCQNGGEFAEVLKQQARNAYGTPILVYLKQVSLWLEKDRLKFLEQLNAYKAWFIKQYVPANADGQVRRGAERFALVAYAGELASQCNITGWSDQVATRAAVTCYRAWLDHRGGVGSQEEQAILEQVRYFFQQYFDSGFVVLKDALSNPPFRKGFRAFEADGSVEFWVLPEIFKREIAKDYDPRLVTKYCVSAGYIIPSRPDSFQQTKRIPLIHGRKSEPRKVYVFSDAVLGKTEKTEN